MVKKAKKTTRNKQTVAPPKTAQLVDKYSRILQLIALISIVALLIIKAFVQTLELPAYVIIGLLGLAVGLGPEQIGKILTDVAKTFIGKK